VVALSISPVVAVLTRAPSSGGKTRLFTALARPIDPALLSALLLDTLEGAAVPGVTRVVAVDPPGSCEEVRGLVPAGVSVRPQVSGSLGDRMRSLLTALLAEGATAVVLLGSDLPDITPAVVEGALGELTRDPASVVLGPADDGGYYLLAATHVPPVFDGIDWGTSRVLAQTLAAAARSGTAAHLLAPMADVDTPTDLQGVQARRTRQWAARLRAPSTD
jgi:rSAM/selenodomain-associated transferase 1